MNIAVVLTLYHDRAYSFYFKVEQIARIKMGCTTFDSFNLTLIHILPI